jgi:hypothetical protein
MTTPIPRSNDEQCIGGRSIVRFADPCPFTCVHRRIEIAEGASDTIRYVLVHDR